MTATIASTSDPTAATDLLAVETSHSARASWHPSLLLVVPAVTLLAAGLVAAGEEPGLPAVVDASLVLAWVVAGMGLTARRVLRPLGLLVLAAAAAGAVAFVGVVARDAGWQGSGAEVSEVGLLVGSMLLPAIGMHLLLALPRGILVSNRRVLVGVGYVAAAAAGAGLWSGEHTKPGSWALLAWLVALAVGLPGAHAAYLRTAGLERQRLQWIGCGAAFYIEVSLVIGALDLLVDWPARPGLWALGASLLVPAALAAGSSPRLASRVDRLLVHTVSVAGLTATTVAVYLVVVVGLGQIPTDADRQLLGLSMLAAGVAAALYLPTRARLQDLANRLVYGERHAPDEVLRTFGSRLSRAIPMDELLLQLAESLKKTLALTRAEVWTGTPELLERSVSVPFSEPVKLVVGDKERPIIARAGVSGQAWVSVWIPALLEGRGRAQVRVAPVAHSGELLGLLVVERPADGDLFDESDDTMLTELARQVGLALHNVQLDSALQATLDEVRHTNQELRASRARIVATGDAERRKIERNIHDGAQQQLVALAVNIRLTKDLVGEDPDTAVEMLEALAASVKDTIAELRNLAHGIYPQLLIDAGLSEALRAAAGRSHLDVSVDVTAERRYGSEIEAAIYFCCMEALQNAGKHAPEAAVTLRVWEEAGGLLFEVVDDGPGFDPPTGVGAGHGYANMADRLGAIGGSVRWDSAVGAGTRITGSVPLVD